MSPEQAEQFYSFLRELQPTLLAVSEKSGEAAASVLGIWEELRGINLKPYALLPEVLTDFEKTMDAWNQRGGTKALAELHQQLQELQELIAKAIPYLPQKGQMVSDPS